MRCFMPYFMHMHINLIYVETKPLLRSILIGNIWRLSARDASAALKGLSEALALIGAHNIGRGRGLLYVVWSRSTEYEAVNGPDKATVRLGAPISRWSPPNTHSFPLAAPNTLR